MDAYSKEGEALKDLFKIKYDEWTQQASTDQLLVN